MGPTKSTHFRLSGKKPYYAWWSGNEGGAPTEGTNYLLSAGPQTVSGTTGSDGLIEHEIPSDLAEAMLEIRIKISRTHTVSQRFSLKLGQLDPVEETTGIQARLNNLGFDCGPINGELNSETQAAIRQFQKWARLSQDGLPGPETVEKLKSAHGC